MSKLRQYTPPTTNKDFINYDWETVYASVDPNTAWKHTKSILRKIIDHHALFISKHVKNKQAASLNSDLNKQMNVQDQIMRKAQKPDMNKSK